eukprot:1648_1
MAEAQLKKSINVAIATAHEDISAYCKTKGWDADIFGSHCCHNISHSPTHFRQDDLVKMTVDIISNHHKKGKYGCYSAFAGKLKQEEIHNGAWFGKHPMPLRPEIIIKRFFDDRKSVGDALKSRYGVIASAKKDVTSKDVEKSIRKMMDDFS